MTGAWQVARVGERWRRAHGRAWLVIRGAGWEGVQFDGPLLELISDRRARTDPRLAALGQDVIGADFDEQLFLRRLREDDPTRGFGDALLNQRTIAGIGNLWKSEACFAARVDPWRPLGEVADEDALSAVRFARERMGTAVREGVRARPGSVYRRAGRACGRCGARIHGRGQGDDNRVTFWCPGCQR
jgi:endonuclease-8